MKVYKKNLFTGLALILTTVYQIAIPHELSAQLKFSIPSFIVKPGDSLSIPIELTGVAPDSSIFSIQFEIAYDPTIISADSVIFNTSPTAISDWKKEFNLIDGKISIALAGTDSVLTDINIANLTFMISEVATSGDSSVVQFENLYVNEGTPTASGRDGMIKVLVVGITELLDNSIPQSPSLDQNFPNPFNPVTTIEFSVPRSGDVSLIIYNANGREIERMVDGEMSAGRFTSVWNATELASGIYFYRLQTGEFVLTRKMVLLK
ncbi:MAG: T9SS type A sorting domain-containing protein [Candidatus Marinimicrobia bacterium]|nr:T9SS type A sorting domain-containing protein [Candidatus Neomarinimicrobiota bacterium]